MSEGYRLRVAGPADADVLVAQRRAMWHDMGQEDGRLLDEMCERYRPWMLEQFARERYFAWLVENRQEPVAGAAVWFRERLPGFTAVPHAGFLCNVYTSPSHRRQGLARRLVEHVIAWAPGAGLDTLELAPSEQGRPLYESFGFAASGELRLSLPGRA